ncbi:hypothetical protein CesoFtcFv8_010365 [Champsocephalus esox]|uniref:Uncharacterized protein n=1 Tax=Champsocephalus esox TaxID=159716 RepID=A0AAN8GZN7_9TELE|nr:hypothetical protein CesoFtcFv8_010365 [Champsocephalus esox]
MVLSVLNTVSGEPTVSGDDSRLMCSRELKPKSMISGILPTYNTPGFCVVWLLRRPQTLKEEDAERPVFEEGFSSRRVFNKAC